MLALLGRARSRIKPSLALDSLGLAAVAIGVGMWILPLGVIVGGIALLVVSRIVDPAPPRDRP
jgi:hypothetical protein